MSMNEIDSMIFHDCFLSLQRHEQLSNPEFDSTRFSLSLNSSTAAATLSPPPRYRRRPAAALPASAALLPRCHHHRHAATRRVLETQNLEPSRTNLSVSTLGRQYFYCRNFDVAGGRVCKCATLHYLLSAYRDKTQPEDRQYIWVRMQLRFGYSNYFAYRDDLRISGSFFDSISTVWEIKVFGFEREYSGPQLKQG